MKLERKFCVNPDCGKEMEPTIHRCKSETKRRWETKRYCSVACSNHHREVKNKGEFPVRHCYICGNEIPRTSEKTHKPVSRANYLRRKTCGKLACYQSQRIKASKECREKTSRKFRTEPGVRERFALGGFDPTPASGETISVDSLREMMNDIIHKPFTARQ